MRTGFFDLFPTPKFLEMPSVGLAISDTAIRIVDLKRSHGRIVLKRYTEKKLKEGIITSGFINNTDELVKNLIALKKEYKLKFVKVTLPEEKAYLFTTEIPNISDDEARGAIEFKIEENVPLKAGSAVFDYALIDAPASSGPNFRKVSVSVLPVKSVNFYTEALSQAGLVPLSFEIESQAIAKAVVRVGDKRTFLLVNLEKNKTGLYIVSDGAVQFTSTIAVGDSNTGSVARQDPDMSIRIFDINNSQDDGAPARNTAHVGSVAERRDEIKRLYDYWHAQIAKNGGTGEKIQKVILCGEIPDKEGFAEYLALALKTDVAVADVWTNCFSHDEFVPPIPREESLSYAAAIGLALPELS